MLNRRQMISGAAGAAAAGFSGILPGPSPLPRVAAALQAEPATAIRWATNEAYSRPSMLDPFTEQTGITVEVEIFSEAWWSRPIDEVLATMVERYRTVC